MARVLAVEVKQIYDTDADEGDLKPFIDAASMLVTEELSSSALSADRLKMIELYLSAHFALISLERGGLIRQQIGNSEEWYQNPGQNKTGLTATRFGQTAVLLDTSGVLGAISEKPIKALFRVVESPNTCF